MVATHKREEPLHRSLQRPLEQIEAEPVLRWTMPAEAGDFTLVGRSRAADGTGFAIPELGWAFDAGVMAHTGRPECIFLSHTHSDHIHELVHLKSRRKPPAIYVPVHAVPLVTDFLNAAQILSDSHPQSAEDIASWTPSYTLHGVVPGDVIEIRRGGTTYVVDVVACDHTVPCVGYAVSESRQKLKPAYVGLPGQEIGRLRREGVEVSSPVKRPLFAYLGDTTTEAFVQTPSLLEMPVVITECSFLDDDEAIARAAKTRHTSWESLAPLVEAHPETLFVLIHFSLRYDPCEVHQFFARIDFPNVFVWLP